MLKLMTVQTDEQRLKVISLDISVSNNHPEPMVILLQEDDICCLDLVRHIPTSSQVSPLVVTNVTVLYYDVTNLAYFRAIHNEVGKQKD